MRPKIPSTDDVRGIRTLVDGSQALVCPAQGFPVPLFRLERRDSSIRAERTRVPAIRGDDPFAVFRGRASVPNCNDVIRAGRQCEAQVPDDRRLQELPHDEGRLGNAAVPRAGLPCSPVQVSRREEGAPRASFSSFSVLLGA